ncbi:hypothetical protein CPB85DRAFT_1258263 [Mucidula mucida]|nr:hypothetical protein CPB85DRAFT_1258263 [Mucidula mucida]
MTNIVAGRLTTVLVLPGFTRPGQRMFVRGKLKSATDITWTMLEMEKMPSAALVSVYVASLLGLNVEVFNLVAQKGRIVRKVTMSALPAYLENSKHDSAAYCK